MNPNRRSVLRWLAGGAAASMLPVSLAGCTAEDQLAAAEACMDPFCRAGEEVMRMSLLDEHVGLTPAELFTHNARDHGVDPRLNNGLLETHLESVDGDWLEDSSFRHITPEDVRNRRTLVFTFIDAGSYVFDASAGQSPAVFHARLQPTAGFLPLSMEQLQIILVSPSGVVYRSHEGEAYTGEIGWYSELSTGELVVLVPLPGVELQPAA